MNGTIILFSAWDGISCSFYLLIFIYNSFSLPWFLPKNEANVLFFLKKLLPPKFPTGIVRGTWDRILEVLKGNCLWLWGWGRFSCLLPRCVLIFLFAHGHVGKITMKMMSWEREMYTALVLFFVLASNSFIWLGKTIIVSSHLYSLCCLFIILIGSESWGQSISQAIRHYFI